MGAGPEDWMRGRGAQACDPRMVFRPRRTLTCQPLESIRFPGPGCHRASGRNSTVGTVSWKLPATDLGMGSVHGERLVLPAVEGNLGFGPMSCPTHSMRWKGLIESEDAAIALADVPRLRSGKSTDYEHLQRFRHRDGRRIWMLVRAVSGSRRDGTPEQDLRDAHGRHGPDRGPAACADEEARFRASRKPCRACSYQWQRSAGEPGVLPMSARSPPRFSASIPNSSAARLACGSASIRTTRAASGRPRRRRTVRVRVAFR